MVGENITMHLYTDGNAAGVMISIEEKERERET